MSGEASFPAAEAPFANSIACGRGWFANSVTCAGVNPEALAGNYAYKSKPYMDIRPSLNDDWLYGFIKEKAKQDQHVIIGRK